MDARIVSAIEPPAAYLGGKRLLADTIIPFIDQVPHAAYIEPFMGMGGIFFRRTRIPPSEVINDISDEIANFFRVIQRHFSEFARQLRWSINSRAHFRQLDSLAPAGLTDIERAARFYYLQRIRFGGRITSHTFGVSPGQPRFNIRKLKIRLEQIHDRLAGVVIENLPYQQLIEQYDTAETLFYCDPPYFNCERDYGNDIFSREDFGRLAAIMRSAKGKAILSINDVPEIREIFTGLAQRAVKTTYSIGRAGNKAAGELIISNFELATVQDSFAW